MNAIEITNLKKVYTQGLRKKVTAIDGLDLTIDSGEIFGFLGPNGAGKSTTIKSILDIIRPTSGKILLSGKEVSDPESRSKVGYLPENPIFYEYLTAEELLLFVGKSFDMEKTDIRKRGDELMAHMGLEDARSTPLRYFSKGMIQKIGIVQAIIHDPDILILDEPASGLDPIGRRQMRDMLLSLKEKGKTIFFSSHILHDVETISDRVGILVDGKLRFCGNLSEVLSCSFERYEIKTGKIDRDMIKEIEKSSINIKNMGDSCTITVKKNMLWETIDILKRDAALFSIEPQRKTLEEIFIELIKFKED